MAQQASTKDAHMVQTCFAHASCDRWAWRSTYFSDALPRTMVVQKTAANAHTFKSCSLDLMGFTGIQPEDDTTSPMNKHASI